MPAPLYFTQQHHMESNMLIPSQSAPTASLNPLSSMSLFQHSLESQESSHMYASYPSQLKSWHPFHSPLIDLSRIQCKENLDCNINTSVDINVNKKNNDEVSVVPPTMATEMPSNPSSDDDALLHDSLEHLCSDASRSSSPLSMSSSSSSSQRSSRSNSVTRKPTIRFIPLSPDHEKKQKRNNARKMKREMHAQHNQQHTHTHTHTHSGSSSNRNTSNPPKLSITYITQQPTKQSKSYSNSQAQHIMRIPLKQR